MRRSVIKICAVVVLSISMLYSGVAWAIDNCLREHGHSDHATLEHRHDQEHGHDHDLGSSIDHNDFQDPAIPIIHCTSLFHPGEPGAVVASFNLKRLGKAAPLHASFAPEAISPEIKNNLWLQSLFKRILNFSFFPLDHTRHPFSSVLQI